MKKQTKLESFQEWINAYGLYVATWSPGDGVTRYKFSNKPGTYYSVNELYTALGYREAATYARGFVDGIYYGRKLQNA